MCRRLENAAVRKSRYQFLSRKEREAVDFINEELLLGLLESGDVSTFNTIIGVIQDLKDVADDRPADIFWVIKNGINMTGMPSFQKAGVNDKDIWSIVAFVKKIGSVKPEDYKAWTAAP